MDAAPEPQPSSPEQQTLLVVMFPRGDSCKPSKFVCTLAPEQVAIVRQWIETVSAVASQQTIGGSMDQRVVPANQMPLFSGRG